MLMMSRLCPSPLHVAGTLHAARSFRPFAQSDDLAPSVLARGQKHHPCRSPASHPLRLFLLRRLRHVLPTLPHHPSQQPAAVARDRGLQHPGMSRASAASLARRIQPTASAGRFGLENSFDRDLPGLSGGERGARPPSTDRSAAASSASPPLASRGRRGSLAGIASRPLPLASAAPPTRAVSTRPTGDTYAARTVGRGERRHQRRATTRSVGPEGQQRQKGGRKR